MIFVSDFLAFFVELISSPYGLAIGGLCLFLCLLAIIIDIMGV